MREKSGKRILCFFFGCERGQRAVEDFVSNRMTNSVRLEAIATRLEAIEIRLEAIAIRLEAIANGNAKRIIAVLIRSCRSRADVTPWSCSHVFFNHQRSPFLFLDIPRDRAMTQGQVTSANQQWTGNMELGIVCPLQP